MTYVVTDSCVKCKYTDCVDVCPVECFHESSNMLVINPDKCIDCGVCVPECPVDAIKSEDNLNSEEQVWRERNKDFSQQWPNIKASKKPLPDANEYKDKTDKFNTYGTE